MPFPTIYLGLGSSLGDRTANLRAALERLQSSERSTVVTGIASIYESPHLGLKAEDAQTYPAHLNTVVRLQTGLEPQELLALITEIENALGRIRSERWGPRSIDIDILIYGDKCVSCRELTIPHPHIASRAFVLVPLNELDPDLEIPGQGRVSALAKAPHIVSQQIVKVASADAIRI